MKKPDLIIVEVVSKVIASLPEKSQFYSELKSQKINLNDILSNLYVFHEVLKKTFGVHHYGIENLIIKTLHEDTKQGVYSEKEASEVAIRLIDLFTKEHKKEITAQKALNQPT